MKRSTLVNAIYNVLKSANHGLSPKEIFELIVETQSFHFKAKSPLNIIQSTIRKSCVGVSLKKSKDKKLFRLTGDGKYTINPSQRFPE
jgi:hypothetical protein